MIDGSDFTALRRTTRLIRDSNKPNFSVLNALFIILVIAIMVVAVISAFKGD